MLFFGNLLKESGVTKRLANTASGPLIDVMTTLIGLTVGASTQADVFLSPRSLKIFGLGLYLSLFFTTIAGVLCLTVPRFVMGIWTNDAELIETGARYLRLVAPAYFFAGLTHPYLAVMKSCERVRFSMLLSIVTMPGPSKS